GPLGAGRGVPGIFGQGPTLLVKKITTRDAPAASSSSRSIQAGRPERRVIFDRIGRAVNTDSLRGTAGGAAGRATAESAGSGRSDRIDPFEGGLPDAQVRVAVPQSPDLFQGPRVPQEAERSQGVLDRLFLLLLGQRPGPA